MARKAKILTDKEVLAQIGTRKLNPGLINPALTVLRGMYLGFIYPHKHLDLVKENALIPLNKLLLNPDLAEKLSDELGSVNLSTLQKLIEDAAVTANKIPEVANKIIDMQRRVQTMIKTADPLAYTGQTAIRALPNIPKIPAPFSGEYINQATQLLFIDTITENERRKSEREYVRRNGVTPVPKENAEDAVRQAAQIFAESHYIADRLDPVKRAAMKASEKALTYTGVVSSEEFEKFQSGLKKKLDADTSDLSSNQVFKKFVKDWPVLGDSIVTAFTGLPVGLSYIAVRELATLSLVVGSNPAVKDIAYRLSTEELRDDEGYHQLGEAINKSVTEEILNGGFKDKREWLDIATGAVMTSPVLWSKVGLHYPGVNYPAEMIQKVQWGARSLRQRLEDGTMKRMLSFIESKDTLDAEKVYETINDYWTKTLGPKYGKELVDKKKQELTEKIGGLINNQSARKETAEALRKKVYGWVKSRFAPMSDDEVMASILKLQDGRVLKSGETFRAKSFADPGTAAAWDNPIVDDAVEYIRGRNKQMRLYDPNLPDDPTYFSASEKFADDSATLDKFYRSRGYMKERLGDDVVIPTRDNLEQTVLNFADRIASPMYNSYLRDSMESARGISTAAIDVLSEGITHPEKYIDDLQMKMIEATTPLKPKSQFGRKVSSWYDAANSGFSSLQNFILLKSRSGDWLKRNIFDDSVRFSINVYDNFKQGKIPTRQGLIDAMNQATPAELFDGMFTRRLMDDADPATVSFLSMVQNGHDPIFGAAEQLQANFLTKTFQMNLASEQDNILRGRLSRYKTEDIIEILKGKETTISLPPVEEIASKGKKVFKIVYRDIQDKLPVDLAKATPRYNFGERSFLPAFKSDVDKALYIVAQTNKSTRDDSYMRFLEGVFPDLTQQEIRQHGLTVREGIKNIVRNAEPGLVDIPVLTSYAKKIPEKKSILTTAGSFSKEEQRIIERFTFTPVKIGERTVLNFTAEEQKMAMDNAIRKSREYMLANQANSAFVTNLGSKLLFSYPSFALKATEFTINELGRSPELFIAGSRIFNMLRETNKENPEWQAHSLTAFGRRFSDLSSLSMAPIFSMLERVDEDTVDKSKDARLDADYQKLKLLPMEQRASILGNRSDLRDHIAKRGMTAIGSFLDTFNNSESMVSLGVGGRMALEYFDIIKKRSPYWMIGSKQLSEFSNAISWKTGWEGIRKISPERVLNRAVAAYESGVFGYGAMHEMLAMRKRGEFEGNTLDQMDMAQKAYANRQLRNLLFTRTFGLGAEIDPQIQEFNNAISEYMGAREFVTPDPKDIAAIKSDNNIKDDSLAEFIWKSAQMFKDKSSESLSDYRQKLVSRYKEIPKFLNYLRENKPAKTWLGLTETDDLINRLPVNLNGPIAKTDNVYRAFARTYAGEYVLNESGDEVYKFDGNKDVGELMAQWRFSNPREKKVLFDNPATQAVVMKFAPDDFNKYRLIKNKNHIVPAEQRIEDTVRDENTVEILDTIKGYNFLNPAGAAMDAFDAFLSDNPEDTKAFINASKEFGQKFLNGINKVSQFIFKPGSSLLSAAETDFLYGMDEQRERFNNPKNGHDRDAAAEADRIYDQLMLSPANRKASPTDQEIRESDLIFQDRVLNAPSIVQDAFHAKYRTMWDSNLTSRTSADDKAIAGTVVGLTDYIPMKAYSSLVYNAFNDPTINADGFKNILTKGETVIQGRKLSDYLKSYGPTRALMQTIELQAKGYKYAFGYQRRPDYNLDDRYENDRFQFIQDNFFMEPNEPREAWEKRFLETMRDKNKFPDLAFNKEMDFLKDKGEGETVNILSRVRAGLFAKIPLDQRTLSRVQSFKDELPYIEDDLPLLRTRLMEDPDLVAILRTSEPRTYRGLQNKIFGPYDRGWLKYTQGSQYSTESIDKMSRYNPGSFSRLYYQNEDFRLKVDTLGIKAPPPMSETSVNRDFTWNGTTYKTGTPDLLAPPAAPAPDLIPPGTFSSLPAMLNYATKAARDRTSQIETAEKNGLPLSAADVAYFKLPASAKVFRSIPGLIGEGFTQGQLGPDEVLTQLRGINDFGVTTGLSTQEDYDRFSGFLNTSSNILGATRFGFNIGRFLDDTFNTPRIPVDSAVADFILAGKRFSNQQVPIDTATSVNIYTPGTLRNEFAADIPAFSREASLPNPNVVDTVSGLHPGTRLIGEATALESPRTTKNAGFPVIGTILAGVTSGFSLYTASQSSRARRRASAKSRAAEEERRRQIELARAQADAQRQEGEQRQLAQQRFQTLQRQESLREQDFTQRVQRLVSEGITFATLAQQPPEFVNTFVDRFEPEVLQFTRRPQFDSNVNLISSIINKLPRARY